MDVSFPYRVTGGGLTDRSGDHVRDMIEQVLFTTPGERVNRPDFGAGLLRLVFAPENDEWVSAAQMMVQSALQQWLGDVIEVESVGVRHRDEAVLIVVQYVERRSQTRRSAEFSHEL